MTGIGDGFHGVLTAAQAGSGWALERIWTAYVRVLRDRLVQDQRDVLLLRLVGGFTVEEVATTLGKSAGAVKALQRRGLAVLRKILFAEGVPR